MAKRMAKNNDDTKSKGHEMTKNPGASSIGSTLHYMESPEKLLE